jgi:hypothetical protein
MSEPTDGEAVRLAHPQSARLEELRDQIRAHPGTIAFREWKSLGRSLAIFEGNLAELQRHLRAPTEVPGLGIELVKNVGDTTVREAYSAELDRTLHNLVASAFSLVDHARRLVQGYPPSAFLEEYERRKAAVTDETVAPFLQKLRNYLLHRSQAPIRYRHSIDNVAGVETNIVGLVSATLLEWDGWGTAASAYIRDCGDGVAIDDAVDRYAGLVRALYDWVFEQFDELHGEDVKASDELRREYNDVLRGQSPGA